MKTTTELTLLSTLLLFSTLTYAAQLQFAETPLPFSNPLNHNSFSVTYDEEFIVRGASTPAIKEAFVFCVFNKDLTIKDTINLNKIKVPKSVPKPNIGIAISVQSVHKIKDHYLALALGWDEKEGTYIYKTLVFKDSGDRLDYKGLAVWSDSGESPTFRNFAVTDEGLFGYLHKIEEAKVVGAQWKEIEIQFINDGALLYGLDNDFFDAIRTGRGIHANYTNSWLATFGDSAYMVDEPENLLNVASRSDTYNFKNKKLIPLEFKNFQKYTLLMNGSKSQKSRHDTRQVVSESLRKDISFNTGLFKFEDQMVIGFRSPISQGDDTFNLTLQMLNQEGEAKRLPMVIENSWLAGVSNDRIFVVEQTKTESSDADGINYSPFFVTLEDFQE